jgi:hypothetical protein
MATVALPLYGFRGFGYAVFCVSAAEGPLVFSKQHKRTLPGGCRDPLIYYAVQFFTADLFIRIVDNPSWLV